MCGNIFIIYEHRKGIMCFGKNGHTLARSMIRFSKKGSKFSFRKIAQLNDQLKSQSNKTKHQPTIHLIVDARTFEPALFGQLENISSIIIHWIFLLWHTWTKIFQIPNISRNNRHKYDQNTTALALLISIVLCSLIRCTLCLLNSPIILS